jgi:hypothetical protein
MRARIRRLAVRHRRGAEATDGQTPQGRALQQTSPGFRWACQPSQALYARDPPSPLLLGLARVSPRPQGPLATEADGEHCGAALPQGRAGRRRLRQGETEPEGRGRRRGLRCQGRSSLRPGRHGRSAVRAHFQSQAPGQAPVPVRPPRRSAPRAGHEEPPATEAEGEHRGAARLQGQAGQRYLRRGEAEPEGWARRRGLPCQLKWSLRGGRLRASAVREHSHSQAPGWTPFASGGLPLVQAARLHAAWLRRAQLVPGPRA